MATKTSASFFAQFSILENGSIRIDTVDGNFTILPSGISLSDKESQMGAFYSMTGQTEPFTIWARSLRHLATIRAIG